MTTSDEDNARIFLSLINDLGKSSHGSEFLKKVREFLKPLKRSQKRAILEPILFQTSIAWEAIKEDVWPADSKTQDDNCFVFLQGDIVETQMILAPGIADSRQTHALWLVLSPDCDAVRAEYVRVAPVFEVTAAVELKERFGIAINLGNHRHFPVIGLPDNEKIYFADLLHPYFIHKEFRSLAISLASLKVEGWHLLNALIQERETRALNISEAVKIRTR